MQAPIGSTEDADENTMPLYQREQENTTAVGCLVLERERVDQAGSSNSSEFEDVVPGLEAFIPKIIREGKRPIGKKETPEASAEDKPVAPLSPMSNHRSEMPKSMTRVVGSSYPLRKCPWK